MSLCALSIGRANACEPTRKLCAGCRLKYYCGEECQREDWPVHKYVCICSQSVQELLEGAGDASRICHAALEAAAKIPEGVQRLDCLLKLLNAQLHHDRANPELLAAAEEAYAKLTKILPKSELSNSLGELQIIYARILLEYDWDNSDPDLRRKLEHILHKIDNSASDLLAGGDAAPAYYLKCMASYLRSQYRPRSQRCNLYLQALHQSLHYMEAHRELVSAGLLASRMICDVWNPMARMNIRAIKELIAREQTFIQACLEHEHVTETETETAKGAVAPVLIPDGIAGVVAEFERMFKAGLTALTKGRQHYSVALLYWHAVVFFCKLAEVAPVDTQAQLQRSRLDAARAGLIAASRANHGPLTSVFECELERELERELECEPGRELECEPERELDE